jgi:hypothetical protein
MENGSSYKSFLQIFKSSFSFTKSFFKSFSFHSEFLIPSFFIYSSFLAVHFYHVIGYTVNLLLNVFIIHPLIFSYSLSFSQYFLPSYKKLFFFSDFTHFFHLTVIFLLFVVLPFSNIMYLGILFSLIKNKIIKNK